MKLHSICLNGIPFEFFGFGLILVGIAVFNKLSLKIALLGLIGILFYKIIFTPFHFFDHIAIEGVGLLNLFALVIGFSILAENFKHSGVPAILPKFLPNGWIGGFALLVLIFIISAFIDNIAAALIGGGIAQVIFRKKVHLGYVIAIVAASNAGGCGSVLGDTTTTMLWIAGIRPAEVINAYVAAIPALVIFGIMASLQQHKLNPIEKDDLPNVHISWKRLAICFLILAGAIVTNLLCHLPAVGVWLAIMVGTLFIDTPWLIARICMPGSVFLVAMVFSASMMPIEKLPLASLKTTFGVGFLSSIFDNIPLTKLALLQGGYDWGFLSFAVGFGGSMIWFGSSAGVAISGMFPESENVGAWLKNGWHVIVAYVISFGILMTIVGWHPGNPMDKIGQIILK